MSCETVEMKAAVTEEELYYPLPTRTLDTIEPGCTVSITALSERNPMLFRKLHAMGLVAGAFATVLRRAPLGDPISISTLGYVLSLRLSEAREISVMVIAGRGSANGCEAADQARP